MIDATINKKKLDSNRSRVIAVIKDRPGATVVIMEGYLFDLTRREIISALNALQQKKSLICQRDPGFPGHWYIRYDPYSTTNEVYPSPPSKHGEDKSNITPGTLISKMSGTYTPSRASTMRPGADDHLKYRSLRGDELVEHRSPFGMQSTPRHFGSRVSDDLNFILKQAQENKK